MHRRNRPGSPPGRGHAVRRGLRRVCSEPGQCIPVGAIMARMIEALGERIDFGFERLHVAARQRAGQLFPDVGEIAAKSGDDLLQFARRPQRFDLPRDVAQLIVEVADVDGASGGAWMRRIGRRRRHWRFRRWSDRCAVAIQRALAFGDFGGGGIDRDRPVGCGAIAGTRPRQGRRAAAMLRRRRAGQPRRTAPSHAFELMRQPVEAGIDLADFFARQCRTSRSGRRRRGRGRQSSS